jgi:5-methylcytosine-specific restriction protein A
MVRMVQIAGRRAVPEWVATHPDQAIPKAVKLRIWDRCDGRCHITGMKIDGLRDEYDFEHIKRLADGGEHRELNLALALRVPHRAKTAAENSAGAKADRMRLKHIGAWPETRAKIRGRGFSRTRPLPSREEA